MMDLQYQQQMHYAQMDAYLHHCHLGQRQQVHYQHQPVAVSRQGKEAMTFPPYVNTQLVNWRPATISVTPQPLHQHPRQLYPKQLHGASHHSTMNPKPSILEQSNINQPMHGYVGVHSQGPPLGAGMTRAHHPHSEPLMPSSQFFDDNFNAHRPEEAALYNPHHGQQQQQQYQAAMRTADHLHHPIPKAVATQATADVLARHITMSPYLPPLQPAQTHVDTSFYEPIDPEDYKSVSYPLFDEDYDMVVSPSSTDSHGPFTPATADYSSSYESYSGSSFSSGLPELGSSYGSHDSDMFMVKPSSCVLVSNDTGGFDGHVRVATVDHYHGTDVSLLDGGLARLDHHPRAEELVDTGIRNTTSLRDIRGYTFSLASSQTARQHRSRRGVPNVAPPATREDSYSQEDEEIDRVNEERRCRDQFLLDGRDMGLSYKEIKRRGRFHEAESTLRGRVRVLTKDKSERVRKPEWTKRDIALLRDAVARYQQRLRTGRCPSSRNGKLPWKRMSIHMKKKGASYLFAPATCAKKWDEVLEEDEEAGDDRE